MRAAESPGVAAAVAGLAGAGAALAVLVANFYLQAYLLVGRSLTLLDEPLVGWLLLGALCGLAGGVTAGLLAPARWLIASVLAWLFWGLTFGLALLASGPHPLGWLALASALPAALLVSWLGGQRRGPGMAGSAVTAGLAGGLGAYAVLGLGVAALGGAARAGLRPAGGGLNDYEGYLVLMGAALWAISLLALALALALAMSGARRAVEQRTSAAIGMSVLTLLALGGLSAGLFDFYVACLVGTPLPPFAWVTGGASC